MSPNLTEVLFALIINETLELKGSVKFCPGGKLIYICDIYSTVQVYLSPYRRVLILYVHAYVATLYHNPAYPNN